MTATITRPGSVQHLHRPRGAHHDIAPVTPEAQGRDWAVILFMGALHVLALVALLPQFWSLTAIGTLAVLYWVTACLGVTIGYHRLLSHRAFRVPRWLERFFATCGALSCQHGPIDWVGLHRHHHKFSDTEPDHHNSHRGFWWSHMGWIWCSGAFPCAWCSCITPPGW
jgi:fatty-acid desaturase